MSIWDEEILGRQHKDRVAFEFLNNKGEKIVKTVDYHCIVDGKEMFCFLADNQPYIVLGSKGRCMKRVILYKKPAILILIALMTVALFQSIYTVQVAEVFFFVFKRSDIMAYLYGSIFLGLSAFVLSKGRDVFFSIRQSKESLFWLPSDAEYNFNDLLHEHDEEAIKLQKEVLEIVAKNYY